MRRNPYSDRKLLACTVTILMPVASAHHSPAAYDIGSVVSIEGTVVELDWRNPHVYFTLEVVGPDGEPFRQVVEADGISSLNSSGFRKEALTLGSHIVVTAHPSRRGPGQRVLGMDVTTSNGAVLPLDHDGRSSGAESLSGRWAPTLASFQEFLFGRAPVSLTDAGRAAVAEIRGGPPQATAVCDALPPPILTAVNVLRTIEIDETSVIMRFDYSGVEVERVIHLDEEAHPADVAPSLLGHSIGRWEGETLVIDTSAYTPHAVGVSGGVPSGPRKHTIERLELTEDRQHLRYEITIEDADYLEDPVTYSALWQYRPDLEASVEACDRESALRYLSEE